VDLPSKALARYATACTPVIARIEHTEVAYASVGILRLMLLKIDAVILCNPR
jgi:hypothetical protein